MANEECRINFRMVSFVLSFRHIIIIIIIISGVAIYFPFISQFLPILILQGMSTVDISYIDRLNH